MRWLTSWLRTRLRGIGSQSIRGVGHNKSVDSDERDGDAVLIEWEGFADPGSYT